MILRGLKPRILIKYNLKSYRVDRNEASLIVTCGGNMADIEGSDQGNKTIRFQRLLSNMAPMLVTVAVISI